MILGFFFAHVKAIELTKPLKEKFCGKKNSQMWYLTNNSA